MLSRMGGLIAMRPMSSHTASPKVLASPASSLKALAKALQVQDIRRSEVAKRLHRDVAGGLAACAAVSEMIRHEVEQGGDRAEVDRMLIRLEETLRKTIQHTRELTAEEFPPVLKAFGLVCHLREYLNGLGRAHPATHIRCEVRGEEPSLTQDQRLSLFRILESLTLAAVEQAGANRLNVVCIFGPGQAEFKVENNGANLFSGANADIDASAILARVTLLRAKIQTSPRATTSGLHRIKLVMPLTTTPQ